MRIAAVALALLVQTQDKKPLKLSRQHPRLFGSVEEIRALARLKPKAWQEVQKAAKEGSGPTPLRVRAQGLVYLIDGDRKAAQKAIEAAKESIRSGISTAREEFLARMWPVAEAYDLCYNAVSRPDRKEMIDYLNQMFDANKEGQVDSIQGPFDGTQFRRLLAFALAGYATWPENPRAQEILEHVKKTELGENLLPVLRLFGEGGGWFEPRHREAGTLFELLQYAELARRVEGYDLFSELKSHFEARCLREMYCDYPGTWKNYKGESRARRFAAAVDRHDPETWERVRAARNILAAAFRESPNGQFLAAYNAEAGDETPTGYAVLDLLYSPEGVGMLPPDAGGTAHLVEGTGTLYARSSWMEDATWFRFQCGDHFTADQPLDQNGFEIFKQGKLACRSGVSSTGPHGINLSMRSIAHNTVLVRWPEEKWESMPGGRAAESNDGGQAVKWAPEHTCRSLELFKKDRGKYETGDILAYRTHDAWTYVCGDATAAYHPDKVKRFVRHVAYLRPDVFVIYDVVESDHPAAWVMNTVGEPKVEGGKVAVKEGEGQLLLQCWLPEKAEPRVVSGYRVGERNYPPEGTSDADRWGKFRLEIDSKEKGRHVFLTLISTAESLPPGKLVNTAESVGLDFGDFLRVTFRADGAPGGRLGDEELPTKIVR
jgi:hypothetical protein